MKIDLKIIIIVALVILSAVFCWMWWTGGNDFLEKENKRLNTEIQNIQKSRDSLLVSRKVLEEEYKKISDRIKEKETLINSLYIKIEEFRRRLQSTEADLEEQKRKLAAIDREIERLRKTPFDRTGQILFNSLLEKIK